MACAAGGGKKGAQRSQKIMIAQSGISPEIGAVMPMERAEEAFRAMWEGKTNGKAVFTR